MIAAEGVKAEKKAKKQQEKHSSKEVVADFSVDPIDYSLAKRIEAGGLDEKRTAADAAKENIQTQSHPSLEAPKDLSFLDLEPTVNAGEPEFKGFTRATADGGTEAASEDQVDLQKAAKAQQAEEDRLAQEKADMERIAAEQEENERIENEKLDKEVAEQQAKE